MSQIYQRKIVILKTLPADQVIPAVGDDNPLGFYIGNPQHNVHRLVTNNAPRLGEVCELAKRPEIARNCLTDTLSVLLYGNGFHQKIAMTVPDAGMEISTDNFNDFSLVGRGRIIAFAAVRTKSAAKINESNLRALLIRQIFFEIAADLPQCFGIGRGIAIPAHVDMDALQINKAMTPGFFKKCFQLRQRDSELVPPAVCTGKHTHAGANGTLAAPRDAAEMFQFLKAVQIDNHPFRVSNRYG